MPKYVNQCSKSINITVFLFSRQILYYAMLIWKFLQEKKKKELALNETTAEIQVSYKKS